MWICCLGMCHVLLGVGDDGHGCLSTGRWLTLANGAGGWPWRASYMRQSQHRPRA